MFIGKNKIPYLFSIVFSFLCLSTLAQQGLVLDIGEIDSTELQQHRQLEYHQFITGSFGTDLLLDGIQLPKFNPQYEYQQRYAATLELLPLNDFVFTGISSGAFGAYSPFYHNRTILSEQAFRVSDKLIIGGYSYGANSVYSAPLPNQNSSYFDSYGSTMFMQYKVSKNFKIETRVSVNQRQLRAPGF